MSERMTVEEAEELVGNSLRDYVFAKEESTRTRTHDSFYTLKHAFRETYGVEQWKRTFESVVAKHELGDFIFDSEALRDS